MARNNVLLKDQPYYFGPIVSVNDSNLIKFRQAIFEKTNILNLDSPPPPPGVPAFTSLKIPPI
jgi:hypothetical protein